MSEAPVIIEAAVNGTTRKDHNPNVPRSPGEIADDALRCIRAGASIVHNHNDDPVLDMVTAEHDPRPYVEAWTPVLEEFPGVLLYPTMTGGGPHTTVEKRYGHLRAMADAGVLTMGIVDPGSVNIAFAAGGQIPGPREIVYLNTIADIDYMFRTCEELGVPTNLSIFDPSFLRTAVAFIRAGRAPNGGEFKIFLGTEGSCMGLPATPTALAAYLECLAGVSWPWAIALPGGDLLQSEVARIALARGGHLRVGLEDYGGPGSPTNEEIVGRAVELVHECGREVATPDEARAIVAAAGRRAG